MKEARQDVADLVNGLCWSKPLHCVVNGLLNHFVHAVLLAFLRRPMHQEGKVENDPASMPCLGDGGNALDFQVRKQAVFVLVPVDGLSKPSLRLVGDVFMD